MVIAIAAQAFIVTQIGVRLGGRVSEGMEVVPFVVEVRDGGRV
jgi:hypothetical protein